MIRFLFFLLFSLTCSSVLSAQKPAELKKAGEKYFAAQRWAEALDALGKYQQVKPGDPGILTKIGISHFHLHHPEQALQFLDYVAKQAPDNRDPDLFYYLARTLHGQQEYEKAIPAYKAYLRVAPERHPLRANAADNILRCVSGQAIPPNDNVALVENLGDRVNTAGDEFAPLPSINRPNRIYYAAAREGSLGGRRNDKGYEDENNGHFCSDMAFAELNPSGWETGGDLGNLLNTPRHEVALDFGLNGQVLYYFRGFTLYSGDIFADTAGMHDEYAVTPPPFNSPFQPQTGDAAPFFFHDSLLLFASRREGGQGGLDIWYALRQNGVWQPAQNLGPAVNSPYDETTPFLARDGYTLYFSANHTGSMGGFDIYRAVFDPQKQEWSAPVNMGAPLNSPGDDAFFRLAADGRAGYLSSDRLSDNFGERDLYIAYFKEALPEQQVEPTAASFAYAGPRNAPDNGGTDAPRDLTLKPLFYTSDRDVLGAENLKTVQMAAAYAKSIPDASVLVTVHTDETGPAKFDLYAGIKRAETIGKALSDQGIAPSRIVLRSVGPCYPAARNVLDAAPNPTGQQLNRRIEIVLLTPDGYVPDVRVERPQVSELMASDGTARMDQLNTGLSYKVEAVTTRQILTSDALSMFGDMMIETQPGAGSYRYTAGWVKQYKDAARLAQEIRGQGFTEATVIAYGNGLRISKAEAVGLVKKYPDLAAFVKG
ncbi:MAG: PD40 domain-containing protein [Saprospiraceae bacterium]|nr:PD40 domain-containing protein [Saprospiraceae bacterium]